MNYKQKIALVVGCAALIASLFFVRWTWDATPYSIRDFRLEEPFEHRTVTEYRAPGSGISSIFSPPKEAARCAARVDLGALLGVWLVIVAVTGVLWFVLKDPPSNTESQNDDYYPDDNDYK